MDQQLNELLTRTGPGTPAGKMMRRYWLPVALSDEVTNERPLAVRILSEDMVLFRDEQGRIGLLQRHCPHRCTDLSYGRLEDGGLRCLYHGWLFDVNGNCLEQPAEPPESKYKDEVKAKHYPLKEIAGLVFTYMGGDAPPIFPMFSAFEAPDERRWVARSIIRCNYLQALDGNIDPVHLSYLHRPAGRVDKRNVPGSDKSADMFYAEDRRPHLDLEDTDYGLRAFSIRKAGEDKQYVRITNFLMPCASAIVGNEGRVNEGYSIHWHVPVDDMHNMRFDLVHNRHRALDKEQYAKRFNNRAGPDGVTIRSLENRYLQDRNAMKEENFTGMGRSFNIHDAFACESMGPISDKTEEHLATSDRIIVRMRSLLRAAIGDVAASKEPRGVLRDAAAADRSHMVVLSEVLPSSEDYKKSWMKRIVGKQLAE
jgi:phthalate 4,5-dioxygenase oxygenase subunit